MKLKLPKIKLGMPKIKLKKLGYLETFLTIIIIGGISTIMYLYTSGFRLKRDVKKGTIDINKTGMISVKSLPTGASVSLDGELRTATDDTVSGISPGTHRLKIVKKGFVEWNKDIQVFEQLVTDITAVLVSQSPRMEPLTNSGVKAPSISPTLTKLAYFSFDSEKPGIWVVPLTSSLGLFRTNPTIAIQDTPYTKYSQGEEIAWSPDEKSLLVRAAGNVYHLINLDTGTAQTTLKAADIKKQWADELTLKRTKFVNGLNTTQEVKTLALLQTSSWAPDEKKFLFTKQNGNQLEYRVYDLENPIPVGEKVETLVFTTTVSDPQPKISWYSDSFHLILVEGNVQKDNKGSISLIRIDGTNKTEVYNNTLYSDSVFSAPSGDKLIVVTSFKSGDQSDLYTVSIR